MGELVYHTERYGICWHNSRSDDAVSFRNRGPCAVFNDGTVKFSQIDPSYYNRTSGPSEIYPNGKIVYTNRYGQYHRTNGPALIYAHSVTEYWVYNQRLTADVFFLKYGAM